MTEASDGRVAALRRAIEHPSIGSQSQLARLLTANMSREIKQGHVSHWLKNGLPAEYCPSVEKITGGDVTCEQLNDRADWAYLRAQVEPEASHV